MTPLSKSSNYRKFITDRDKALEKILNKYIQAQSHIMDFLLQGIQDSVLSMYSINKFTIYHKSSRFHEKKLDHLFQIASNLTKEMFHKLTLTTYAIAHVGEVQAISQAIGKPRKANLTKEKINQRVNAPSTAGGTINDRIDYYFNKLKRDIINAIDLSMVMESPKQDTLNRIYKVFPKKSVIKVPRRQLKPVPIREADTDDIRDKLIELGFIDEDIWNQAVEDYLSEYLPANSVFRDIEDRVEEHGVEHYAWEVEQEMTQKFVDETRAGQNDAAKENGIKDFMWIAILDDRTDDCCEWRDGLTSSEIEAELDSKHKDDECDATVPPAHFNCRCTMAPITTELPEQEPDTTEDFQDWLRS